ncbi:hypothetical protein EYF80_068018 [Liparis tanakae]|uniref:Uncharacterized protein n=1 Tax=Liparis tanakae TaxID=230148 RepID=A0A4Z2E037_9TELE|nr:hypothetical protein EYF80_068018 [Liparis tanakae]
MFGAQGGNGIKTNAVLERNAGCSSFPDVSSQEYEVLDPRPGPGPDHLDGLHVHCKTHPEPVDHMHEVCSNFH